MNSSQQTLPALLTHALIAFTREYERTDGLPELVVWSNILRGIGDDGVDLRELPALGRISIRAVRVATNDLDRRGWLRAPRKQVRQRSD